MTANLRSNPLLRPSFSDQVQNFGFIRRTQFLARLTRRQKLHLREEFFGFDL